MPCFLFNSFSKWWELSDQPQTRRPGGKTRTFGFYLPSLLLALLHWRESSSNSVERTIHYPQPFHNQSQLLYSFMLHVGRLTWFWQCKYMYDLKVSICLAYILKVRGERGWREEKGKERGGEMWVEGRGREVSWVICIICRNKIQLWNALESRLRSVPLKL